MHINVYRSADGTKSSRKNRTHSLIGTVQIDIADVSGTQPIERWYPLMGGDLGGAKPSKSCANSSDWPPAVRVKAKYTSVRVLPLALYTPMLHWIESNYLALCQNLEPNLAARGKEQLASGLVRVLMGRPIGRQFLVDVIMSEIEQIDNETLMFRGNSVATKAMEAFQKLTAESYLRETLAEFVKSVLDADDDCEVDPLKVSGGQSAVDSHRRLLVFYVEAVWRRILDSAQFFPLELSQVFADLRSRLSAIDRADLADNLTSSSIFLRFLCPAILSPSLFNLVTEFPSERGARTLTLIAKTLQTLANFTKFGGKEHYMDFMNTFVEREWNRMRAFLRHISTQSQPPTDQHSLHQSHPLVVSDSSLDFAKEAATLHEYLAGNSALLRAKGAEFEGLDGILSDLNSAHNDPETALARYKMSQNVHQRTNASQNVRQHTNLDTLENLRPARPNCQGPVSVSNASSPMSDYENSDPTPLEGSGTAPRTSCNLHPPPSTHHNPPQALQGSPTTAQVDDNQPNSAPSNPHTKMAVQAVGGAKIGPLRLADGGSSSGYQSNQSTSSSPVDRSNSKPDSRKGNVLATGGAVSAVSALDVVNPMFAEGMAQSMVETRNENNDLTLTSAGICKSLQLSGTGPNGNRAKRGKLAVAWSPSSSEDSTGTQNCVSNNNNNNTLTSSQHSPVCSNASTSSGSGIGSGAGSPPGPKANASCSSLGNGTSAGNGTRCVRPRTNPRWTHGGRERDGRLAQVQSVDFSTEAPSAAKCDQAAYSSSATDPHWQQALIQPIMDRLRVLESQVEAQMSESRHKDTVIEQQRRQIDALLDANKKLAGTVPRFLGSQHNLQQAELNSRGVSEEKPKFLQRRSNTLSELHLAQGQTQLEHTVLAVPVQAEHV